MSVARQLAGFNRRFSFSCKTLDLGTTLDVVRFEGEEALTGLYRFEILLVSANNDIDECKLVGQQADFQLNDGVPGGEETCYSGLIASFEQLHQITGWTFYKAVLVPKLWQLSQFHLSEVYLDKTPRELLEIILNNAGLNGDDYSLAFLEPAGYPAQKFICQYKESYLDFITRWCEHLGVYWWFSRQQGAEQVVFGNNYRNHDAHVIKLNYQPARELDADVTSGRRVQSFNVFAQSLPKQVTVTDYYYNRASLQIKATAIVNEQGVGEVNYYGMYVETNEAAQAIAKIRAEGLICRGRQFSGESTATGLRCGYFMELAGHYRANFNQRYLLIQVSHRGSQAGLLLEGLGVQDDESSETFYQAGFSAIPADVQFRPDIIHFWPKIEGMLTAFIDAEGSGKYAEINEYGEYKVQVPYDITEKSPDKASAWIRMASPYAGAGDECSAHGMHFPLHKGTEVLLSFHNGNPDEPIIIGAVTNSQTSNMVTNENQTQAVIQTAGGNSLEFHDQEGQQGIHFFTPTATTKFSMGMPPPAAKGVGADSSSSGSGQGVTFETTGSFNVSAQNALLDIGGASTNNILGAYTTLVEGANTTATVGVLTNFNVGGVLTVALAGGVTLNGGPVLALNVDKTGIHNVETTIAAEKQKVVTAYTQAIATEVKLVSDKLVLTNSEISTTNNKLKDTVTEIDNKINAVKDTVTEVDSKVNTVKDTVTQVDSRVTTLKDTVTEVDTKVTAVKETVTKVENNVTSLQETTAALENKTTQVTNITAYINNGVVILVP